MGYFKLFHHMDNEIHVIFSDSLSQGEGPGTLKRAAVTVEASRNFNGKWAVSSPLLATGYLKGWNPTQLNFRDEIMAAKINF